MFNGNLLVFFDNDGHGHAVRFDTPEQREKILRQLTHSLPPRREHGQDEQDELVYQLLSDDPDVWENGNDRLERLSYQCFQRDGLYCVNVEDDTQADIEA